jgi:hypothetical protein
MTGHQKRRPVAKKVKCSIKCQGGDFIPKSSNAGTCHTTNAAAAANQQNNGWPRSLPVFGMSGHRDTKRIGGRPYRNGITGAPSQINGGANVMSSRCWTMWAVSILPSKEAMGEAAATHVKQRPRQKPAARQAGIDFEQDERRWSQPRK